MPSRQNSLVFSPGRIGNLEIENRLVRSATFEHAATPEGEVSEALIRIHTILARGGVGLIVAGIAWIHPRTLAPPHITRADADTFLPGLTRLAQAVHDARPGCRILLQLHHPGRQVITPDAPLSPAALPPGMVAYANRHPEAPSHPAEPGLVPEPVAPSALPDALFHRTPRALSLEEIEEIIEAFAEGIRRARDAGFDGAQLHAAHGWLLSSFLSPHTNRRQDAYGGSLENRTRILRDIIGRARKQVGPDFPILIKLNATDFLPDGTDLDEAVAITRILAKEGCDALEISGGMWECITRSREELGWPPVLLPESRTEIRTAGQEAYFLPAAARIKEETGATIISVGGYRSFTAIEKALTSGAADFVALARPLVRQPDLPKRWLAGKGADRATCISCNACLPVGKESLACRAVIER
ncbi:MAG: NADH:flavin oxidoreductase [Deltaproteobacteria bacterium]|nr:NADH:flavin oxidoreductase [Deltaproteobacteria bacterium]